MTSLQHAAFRGNFELCEWLLARGADVNTDQHENKYTTLMFAALSGNGDRVTDRTCSCFPYLHHTVE